MPNVGPLTELMLSEENSRIVVITIAVLLLLFAILIGITIALFKAVRSIKTQSKQEYDDEREMVEYRNKVDETKKDIEYISDLLVRLTETINANNQKTSKELEEIKEAMSVNGDGCVFGQNLAREVKEMKDGLLKEMKDDIALLIDSDKESIKTYITNEYHKWMELRYIDIYSLKGIDERFDKYRKEKGNTFVEGMVKELHLLQKTCIATNCVTKRMQKERDDLCIYPSQTIHELPCNTDYDEDEHGEKDSSASTF